MRAKTFAELYCEAHALSPEEFAPVVLNQCLYPHVRLCGWLVTLFHRRYFEADYDFVHDAGRLMRFRDFDLAVDEFLYHPGNRGFWRRVLRVRISSQRLRRLVRTTLHPRVADEAVTDEAGTQVPFGGPEKPADRGERATSGA